MLEEVLNDKEKLINCIEFVLEDIREQKGEISKNNEYWNRIYSSLNKLVNGERNLEGYNFYKNNSHLFLGYSCDEELRKNCRNFDK